MFENIIAGIVNQMINEGIAANEWKENYIYALITIIEKYITILTIIFISLLYKKFIPTVLFLLIFFSLRKRTGGYHADKFWKCYIGTIIVYALVLLTYHYFIDNKFILYGGLIISIVIIEKIGTINHPNIHMDSHELNDSKKTARIIAILEGAVILGAHILNINKICISFMIMAIMLCAFFMCLSKIIKQEVNVSE
jgi:accessory gene regulator B